MIYQGNSEDTGIAAVSTADGLKQVVASARGIAATMPSDSSMSPTGVLDAADDILDKSANLIAAARTATADPDNPDSRAQLTQVSLRPFCCHTYHRIVPPSSFLLAVLLRQLVTLGFVVEENLF